MALLSFTMIFYSLAPHFSFPEGGGAAEFIVLRWLHLVFGIIWIGLLYFFNLVGFPTMKQLDASVRGKVYPALMSRATRVTRRSRSNGSAGGWPYGSRLTC